MTLELKNPHSVLAALETRPESVVEVRLPKPPPSHAWDDVAQLAAHHRIPVLPPMPLREPGRRGRTEPAPKSGRTGAAFATVREREPVPLDALFADVASSDRGLWLALDCLQDPHNVGAVFRSAAFFGVRGVVMTKDRSAPLNATVYDVASGGLEHVPFALGTNLSRSLAAAKKAGLWVLGSSEHATEDIAQVDRDRPWLLVLGNEEKGMRRLTAEHCDALCRIAPRGSVTSLNVSVAAGILIATLAGGGQPER